MVSFYINELQNGASIEIRPNFTLKATMLAIALEDDQLSDRHYSDATFTIMSRVKKGEVTTHHCVTVSVFEDPAQLRFLFMRDFDMNEAPSSMKVHVQQDTEKYAYDVNVGDIGSFLRFLKQREGKDMLHVQFGGFEEDVKRENEEVAG